MEVSLRQNCASGFCHETFVEASGLPSALVPLEVCVNVLPFVRQGPRAYFRITPEAIGRERIALRRAVDTI